MPAPPRVVTASSEPSDGNPVVVQVRGDAVVLASSPLLPSLENFDGDRGWINGVPVVDVYGRAAGVVHRLEEPLEVAPGDRVAAVVDADRRGRLERIHAAAVLVVARLGPASRFISSVEIVAGLAWLDICAPAPPISITVDVEADVTLSRGTVHRDRQLIMVGSIAPSEAPRPVCTWARPIATHARVLAGTAVRTLAEPRSRSSVIEIALPDAAGRWWR